MRARKHLFSARLLMSDWIADTPYRLKQQSRKGLSFSQYPLVNFIYFPLVFSAFSSLTLRPLIFSYGKIESLYNPCSVLLFL